MEDQRVQGFNSLFATFSIKAARAYYAEFERQQQDLPPEKRLKIATIYSYSPNSEDPDTGLLCEESMDTKALSADDRDFLDRVIAQYNKEFGTNFGTDPARFENYYEHLSKALATKAVDLVIVVDMFLTGFDSKTLNTLWVDKNLRAHGLIQAFSRTNRILNSVKPTEILSVSVTWKKKLKKPLRCLATKMRAVRYFCVHTMNTCLSILRQ